ncbi:hypothetical protein [Streptomyces sennicomposti]
MLIVAGVPLGVHRRRVLVAAVLGADLTMLLRRLGLAVDREVYLGALPDTVSRLPGRSTTNWPGSRARPSATSWRSPW